MANEVVSQQKHCSWFMHEDRLLFWDKEKHHDPVKCASILLNMKEMFVGQFSALSFCESRCRYLQKVKIDKHLLQVQPLLVGF